MPRALFTIPLAIVIIVGTSACAGDAWRTVTAAQGLPDNGIQFLKEDASGAVWIGTSQGLAVSRDGKITTVVKDIGAAYDILPVAGGKYWLGTGNGLLLIDGDGARKGAFMEGNLVAPIVQYDDKTVWAISKNSKTEHNTLIGSDGAGFIPIERFKSEKVVDLVRTSNGHLWVVVDGNGMYEVDPAAGPGQAVQHLKGRNVKIVAEVDGKQVWAGLEGGGVMVYDGKGWAANLEKEKCTYFAIRGDAQGRVWVATNKGLWCLDSGKWTHLLADEGPVNMLATTSSGVWISTQMTGGLRRFADGQWKMELESQVNCLLESKDKKIWAGGTLDGVHVCP